MTISRKNNVVVLFVNQIREARKSRISKQPSGDENYVKIILQHQSGRIGRLFNTGALLQVNIYFTQQFIDIHLYEKL